MRQIICVACGLQIAACAVLPMEGAGLFLRQRWTRCVCTSCPEQRKKSFGLIFETGRRIYFTVPSISFASRSERAATAQKARFGGSP